MTAALPSFAAFRGPVDRAALEPGFSEWRRAGALLRRLLRNLVTLPDRGGNATVENLPPEYFRFPPF
jgi:hypothetical protein